MALVNNDQRVNQTSTMVQNSFMTVHAMMHLRRLIKKSRKHSNASYLIAICVRDLVRAFVQGGGSG